jgi:hypothetical protein
LNNIDLNKNEKEIKRINGRSDKTVNGLKELLEKNLYNHIRLNDDESVKSEIVAMKRSFDKVFQDYENTKEDNPSFLRLD